MNRIWLSSLALVVSVFFFGCSSHGTGVIANGVIAPETPAPDPTDAAIADAKPREAFDADPPPGQVPSVFIVSQMGPGTDVGVNDSQACGLPTQEWLKLGTRDDLAKSGTHGVGVHCLVVPRPNTNEFEVDAQANLDGVGGFTVYDPRVGPNSHGPIDAVFRREDTGTFVEQGCAWSFDDTGDGIAPGEVTASVTCNRVELVNGSQPRTCKGWAAFHFANCIGTP
jgi:hypothetical protein